MLDATTTMMTINTYQTGEMLETNLYDRCEILHFTEVVSSDMSLQPRRSFFGTHEPSTKGTFSVLQPAVRNIHDEQYNASPYKALISEDFGMGKCTGHHRHGNYIRIGDEIPGAAMIERARGVFLPRLFSQPAREATPTMMPMLEEKGWHVSSYNPWPNFSHVS
jgi:hypothetical protein